MTAVLFPETVAAALALLADHPEARPLAGGATLIAMRNAGLVEPSHLVSLDRIAGLGGIAALPGGGIRIGAMTRHAETAASATLTGSHAVLRQAAGGIANRIVRNMGTIGGAVANADPAADYLPALACLDAVLVVAGPAGERAVPVTGYVTGWYETALQPGELIVAVDLPPAAGAPAVWRKVARVPGDYATASCAMTLDADGQGIRCAIGACGPGPLRDPGAEADLRGRLGDPAAVAAFAARLAEMADPVDDVRGSADYRRSLIPRLVAAGIADLLTLRKAA